ncbi:MAG TPA: glycine/sarcosine/betaine reductase component B subunit [Gammaproteobacteria bacterium]|jgi:glycine reductase
MTLAIRRKRVGSLGPGAATALAGDRLTIDIDALQAFVAGRDERIEAVHVHIAAPGESVRILCAKDVIEPRVKLAGDSPGEGTTLILDGVAVVTTGPIVGFQEGVIDMTGPGADYSPFSSLGLVVIEIEVRAGTPPHEHEAAVRAAGLDAAGHIAAQCADVVPDRTDDLAWNETDVDAALPRVAYVDMLLSQGLLHDTYVLGRSAIEGLPRSLDPRVAIDGGIVSGNCVSACDKTTTWHHQNNPVITRLLDGHGKRWNFVGLVLTNVPTRLAEKQRSAERAVALVRELAPAGALVSKEGFGNPDADLMMLLRGLESAGIRTVAITDEYAGPDGDSQSLADTAPEADALISVGNANAKLRLPPMDRVIGPLPDVARLAGGYPHSLGDDGSLEVELQAIVGATNQLGFSSLSCREI